MTSQLPNFPTNDAICPPPIFGSDIYLRGRSSKLRQADFNRDTTFKIALGIFLALCLDARP